MAGRTFRDPRGVQWDVAETEGARARDGSGRPTDPRPAPALLFATATRFRVKFDYIAHGGRSLAQLDDGDLLELLFEAEHAYSEYVWCRSCERAFRPEQAVPIPLGRLGVRPRCPYGKCSAPVSDAVEWDELRAIRSDLPPRPQAGVRYRVADGARGLP